MRLASSGRLGPAQALARVLEGMPYQPESRGGLAGVGINVVAIVAFLWLVLCVHVIGKVTRAHRVLDPGAEIERS